MKPLSQGDRVRYVPSTYAITAHFERSLLLTECISETRRGEYLRDEKGFALIKWDEGDDGPMMVSPASICRVGDEVAWQKAQVQMPPNEAPTGKVVAIGPYKYEPPKFFWFLVDGARRQFCEICKDTIKRHMPHKWDGETDVAKVRELRTQYKEDRHPRFRATGEQALTCELCGRRGPKRAGE